MNWIRALEVAIPVLSAAILVILFFRARRQDRLRPASPLTSAPFSVEGGEDTDAGTPPRLVSLSEARSAGVSWVRSSWPELLAGLAAVAIVFFLLFSLPRMNPGRPPLPNTPDRPFYSLHWQYEFLLRIVPVLFRGWPVAASLLILALAVGAGRSDWRQGVRLTWLVASLAVAVQAQLALASQRIGLGMCLYLAAFGAMLVWGITYGARASQSLAPTRSAPAAEWFWLVVVLALALFFRTYRLGLYPYGLEGDEVKFSSYLVSVVIDGQHVRDSDLNLGLLPGHTYMELPFQRLLGPGIFAARAAQCFYNLLGVAAFFWLVRQLFRVPVAIIATLFLAVSLMDASSARHGALENFVSLWSSLSFALLALAVRKRRSGFFGLAGLGAACGLLTLDTFLPAAGTLAVLFIYEVVRMRGASAAERVRHAVFFFAPLLLVSVAVVANFSRRFSYYGLQSQNWTATFWATLRRNGADAFSLFFYKLPLQPDFSYNRDGPLDNSLILPLLVLGLAFGVSNFHRSRAGWGALWFILGFVPILTLIHFPLPRVIYPSVPSIYLLAGVGSWLIVSQVGEAGPAWRVGAFGALAIGLAFYVASSGYLAFNMVPERDLVRVARRELYDGVAGSAAKGTVIYLPYVPEAGDLIELEKDTTVKLAARDAGWRLKSEGGFTPHQALPLGELLPELLRPEARREQAVVVYSRSPRQEAEREQALAAMLRCFPGTKKQRTGDYFDVYTISQSAFREGACRSKP